MLILKRTLYTTVVCFLDFKSFFILNHTRETQSCLCILHKLHTDIQFSLFLFWHILVCSRSALFQGSTHPQPPPHYQHHHYHDHKCYPWIGTTDILPLKSLGCFYSKWKMDLNRTTLQIIWLCHSREKLCI